MKTARQALVEVIAAFAALGTKRGPEAGQRIAAMLLLAAALTLPLLAIFLLVLRLLTHAHPLVKQPYLDMGLEAAVFSAIIASELLRRLHADIDAQVAFLDSLGPALRQRRLLARMTVGAVA